MESPNPHDRPYRSHLRPACVPCRRRKSRCKIESGSPDCLMCRVHGTDCVFPGDGEIIEPESPKATRVKKQAVRRRLTPSAPILITPQPSILTEQTTSAERISDERSLSTSNPWSELRSDGTDHRPTPLSMNDEAQENPHIVGPANTRDSQVLADYLSIISEEGSGIRMIRPMPTSRSKPVLFATVKKRPVGVDDDANPSRHKLVIIEKLLEPLAEKLTDLYFEKVNICLPLLDHESFTSQYRHAKEKISPALLANLYAHSMTYWSFSPELSRNRTPDHRFIWNLANEALYSELHLSPGISTVTAILLNVGGRPTTSLIGNGVLFGAAVSLAHSLGLNRNPIPWDVPEAEKFLRMKIWWSLIIHDRWSSLAHGTPPHIQRIQHDVVPPELAFFHSQSLSPATLEAASVFIALYGLTEVLDYYLQYLYSTDRDQNGHVANLEFKLNQWVESLTTDVRRIITRGTRLDLPGAANLRLTYLSAQLLLRRLELEHDRDRDISPEMLENRYMQVRRTAEEVVLLVQELQEDQLGGFWLPMSAFVFSSTTTFLLRCALETENSQAGLAQNSSLRLAGDLIAALRSHRDSIGWDLGDICMAQYAETVEKLMTCSKPSDAGLSLPDLQEITMQDSSFIDDLFPSLWDTLRGT